MAEQFEAIRGRRFPTGYRSVIATEAKDLPTIYALRDKKAAAKKTLALRAKGLSLAERSQKLQEKEAKKASYLGLAQLGTQAYLGYKAGGSGAGTAARGLLGGGAGAGVGTGAGTTGMSMAPLTSGNIGGGTAVGSGAGSGVSAGTIGGYAFAAYVMYSLWKGEKKRGAKYPGQPLLKAIGKTKFSFPKAGKGLVKTLTFGKFG